MLDLVRRIVTVARATKAQKVTVLDMRDVSTFCDYFILLSATSLRHVNGLAKNIQGELEQDGIKSLSKIASSDESGWVVLDYGSVVTHIFNKPTREYYSLERLWSDAKKIRVLAKRPAKKKKIK